MEPINIKKCKTCKWFDGTRVGISIGFCHKHAPTIEGLPQTFSIGWCGDHEDIKEVKLEGNKK